MEVKNSPDETSLLADSQTAGITFGLQAGERRQGAARLVMPEQPLKPSSPRVEPLPTTHQLEISWRNLSYTIADKNSDSGRKVVLDNVSGDAKPGRLLAIIGPSGAGKTSLINALAGRVPKSAKGDLSGTLYLNGQRLAPGFAMKDISAYVTQEDTLFGLSSVRETFSFACRLRNLPDERVDETIRELGLINSAETRVGNELMRGLSGGEKKRVNIGLDLLHNPCLIFLDEPTTGLDSFQALTTMRTLKALAESGRTVICSIHQPRSSIYALLDDICILASHGQPVYFGPAGAAAVSYFAAIDPVPRFYNPPDHFLDSISVDYRTESSRKATEARLARHVSRFRQEQWRFKHPASDNRTNISVVVKGIKKLKKTHRGACSQFWLSAWLLLVRAAKELYRNWPLITVQIVINFGLSMIFGLTYQNLPDTQDSVPNRMGLYFFLIMNNSFGAAIQTAQEIPRQLAVVQKERLASMYTIPPYYFTTFLVTLPHVMVPNMIASAIIYYMANLRHGWDHFIIFWAALCCLAVMANLIGMWFSAMMPMSGKAADMVPIFVIICLMFSGGTFLSEDSIPEWLAWLKYISFMRYPYQILMVNEFRDNIFKPSTTPGGDLYPRDGNLFLQALGFQDVVLWKNFLICGAMTLAFMILGMVSLWFNSPKFIPIKNSKDRASFRTEERQSLGSNLSRPSPRVSDNLI